MGIVNVTPDSFSDGGSFLDTRAAIEHARSLVVDGAQIVDVGGESTRPGAEPVGVQEELRRVQPVVEQLAATDWGPARPQISIDTSKAPVARAALAAGASLVNDVTALRGDRQMAQLVAESAGDCCLVHMLGEPRTMHREPHYEDVVDEVKAFLDERLAFAVDEGIAEQRVLLDPGIGFGKTIEHNLQLLSRLDEIAALGRPLVIGTSRKSFLGRIAGDADAAPPGGDDRHQRARAGARRERFSRARGCAAARCAHGGCCYVGRQVDDEPRGDDSDDLDDDDVGEPDGDREGASEAVTVEISGLSLYTHHGVSEAEREVGQRLVLDLRLEIGESDATITDSLEDTVDYGEVCQLVALIAQQRSHKTLERLCSTIANRLLADYDLEGVWVKATKPEPPIPLTVDEVSVEVWREAEG